MDVDRRGHLVELQSLRGVAALTVFMGHLAGIYGGPHWWMRLVPVLNGRAAVGTFFILSGFVLTRMLQDKILNSNSYIEFYVRRIFRIYPVLLVAASASLTFTIIYRTFYLNVPNGWFHSYFTASRQSPLLLMLCFAGLSAHLLPQAWTITVELAASALMPFIAWAALQPRGAKGLACLLPPLLLLAVTVGPRTPYSILMYMPHFIIGSLLFVMPDVMRERMAELPFKAVSVLAAAAILLAFRSFFSRPFNDPWMAMVELACATYIIAMLTAGRADIPVLRSRTLEWLGDISYSLYLIHFPVIFTVVTVILLGGQALGISVPPVLAAFITAAVCLAIVLPLSALSLNFVEIPLNDVGKRIGRRLRPAPGSVAGPVSAAEGSARA